MGDNNNNDNIVVVSRARVRRIVAHRRRPRMKDDDDDNNNNNNSNSSSSSIKGAVWKGAVEENEQSGVEVSVGGIVVVFAVFVGVAPLYIRLQYGKLPFYGNVACMTICRHCM